MPRDSGHPPYFPFFPGDFANDGKVEAMGTLAVGAYTLLLCKAWFENPCGSVPDDDGVLARWSRLNVKGWLSIKDSVLSPWTKGPDGRWHQPRMQREFTKFKTVSQARASAARERWKGKAKEVHVESNSNANALQVVCTSDSGSYSSSNSGGGEGDPTPPEGDVGDGLDAEVRAYVGGHRMLIWDPKLHAACRKLVETEGWTKAREYVDEAIRRGKSFPVSYAIGMAQKDHQAGAAANGRMTAAEERNKAACEAAGAEVEAELAAGKGRRRR